MSCPFRTEEEHEETPDSDDNLDFTQSVPVKVPMRQLGSVSARPTVGVREPRRMKPKSLAAAKSLPRKPSAEQLPELVGLPVEEKVGKITGVPEVIHKVMEDAQRATGRASASATFSGEDAAFLDEIGVYRGTLASTAGELRLSGMQRMDAVQNQMAEEAAAEAVAPEETSQLGMVQRMLESPAALLPIPLLHALRTIVKGRLGKAGPMDPVRTKSTFRTSNEPRIQSYAGLFKGRGAAAPAKGFAGGGYIFNAAERMSVMVEGAKKSLATQIGGEGG